MKKLSLFILLIIVIGFGMYRSQAVRPQYLSGSAAPEATVSVQAELTLPPPSPTTDPNPYPWHTDVNATIFWVGEGEGPENGFIANHESAWDKEWLEHYGGIDTPYERSGFYPRDFIPGENPFYVALPYNDIGPEGRKKNANRIYWNRKIDEWQSVVKNRWVQVRYQGKSCWGQWEDVGPFEMDDVDYVFGSAPPIYEAAGIDLSPALRTCLFMPMKGKVSWRFADESHVPAGPWKETVTASGVNW